jgi:CubicO group peptidase (beta-lactamase class C family)
MTDTRFTAFEQQIETAMQRLAVPGVAYGVVQDGVMQVGGLGVTNINHPLPVDADTLFQIGSITKTVLGTAVMQLVARQQIDLDAPVQYYLPEFRLQDSVAASLVTMRHLLTHTGGFRGDFFIDTGWGDDALVQYVARMAELPQLTPVGSLWSYCNAGFSLAGRIVEVVTNKLVEQAIKELVFEPFGLDRAFFFPHEVMLHRFAVGHRSSPDGPQVVPLWPIPRASAAAGGISTSVTHLLRYAEQHLAASGALARMQEPQAPAGNFADQVGLSWMLRRIGGVDLVRHGGATYGQMAELILAPGRQFALAILANGDRGGMLNLEVGTWALNHFLGARDPQPQILERSQAELVEYAGLYQAALNHVQLTQQDGQLIAQVLPQGGFPTDDTPPPPAPPAVRLAFTAADRLLALDPPYKDQRMEVIRDTAGQVVWLRMGGRIHRRVR